MQKVTANLEAMQENRSHITEKSWKPMNYIPIAY